MLQALISPQVDSHQNNIAEYLQHIPDTQPDSQDLVDNQLGVESQSSDLGFFVDVGKRQASMMFKQADEGEAKSRRVNGQDHELWNKMTTIMDTQLQKQSTKHLADVQAAVRTEIAPVLADIGIIKTEQ